MRIFISYSRRDSSVADALVDALTNRDFDVKIDRRDLPFGRKWQDELAEFIRLSDTVIWLVSVASIRSEWVNWELDEVARRTKRLVPVMIGETERDQLPRQLGAINILPVEGIFDLASDLDLLERVLNTDYAWLKEGSRLADRAHEWLTRERAPALLLRSAALSSAESWKERRPSKAPPPGQEVLDLILASRQAATHRQWWWLGGSFALTIAAVVVAGFAYHQSVRAKHSEATTAKISQESQVTEAGLLSTSAREISKLPGGGDAPLAMLLALEGMRDTASPDLRQKQRPPVAETRFELEKALRANREISVLPLAEDAQIFAWSPDGTRVAFASTEGIVQIAEVGTSKKVAISSPAGRLRAVAWSADGRFLAIGSGDTLNPGEARIIEVASGNTVTSIAHNREVIALRWSNDGQFLATGSAGGSLQVVETSGKVLIQRSYNRAVSVLAWSSNSRQLAAGLWDDTTRLFDIPSGQETNNISHRGRILALDWSPDGRLLATGSGEGDQVSEARIIEASSGQDLARIQHDGQLLAAAWSEDGRFLATGTRFGMARIFDARAFST